MKNIPDKIYLDIGTDCDADDFDELHEVTWSACDAMGGGIEYHRRAPLPANVAEAWALLSNSMPSTLYLGPPDDCPEPFLHLDPHGMIALRTILEHMKEPSDGR